MTAARRGQKVCFPPTATSTVAKLPQWGRPADPQPRHPRQRARACQPDGRLNVERESDRPRSHPTHTVSSGTRSVLHPRSTSFTTVAFVPSVSASLRMTSL